MRLDVLCSKLRTPCSRHCPCLMCLRAPCCLWAAPPLLVTPEFAKQRHLQCETDLFVACNPLRPVHACTAAASTSAEPARTRASIALYGEASASLSSAKRSIRSKRACMEARSHYDVLGLEPGCSHLELKAAYRRLLVQTHPDKQCEPQQDGEPARHDTQNRLSAIQDAYAVLRDAERRREYDRQLQAEAVQQQVHPWQRITPDDMDSHDVEDSRTYDCRCGEVFEAPMTELPTLAAHEGATGGSEALMLECRSCGNVLEIVAQL